MVSNNKVYSPAEVADFHATSTRAAPVFVSAPTGGLWGRGAITTTSPRALRRRGLHDNGSVHALARAEAGRYQVADPPVLSGPDGAGGSSA